MSVTGNIVTTPLVTVLMPVYNAEKFVAEAVQSMLVQTYFQFELLIIDDHSTDRSAEIIRSFRDPRVQLVHNGRNEGITASLNKGIVMAKGELIARMDADDVSHPWRLEKQVAYMQSHPDCAMLSTWVRIIDEQGDYLRSEGTRAKYLYYNLFFECCIFHSTVMFRKDMLLASGGYRLAYAEDFELFRRVSRNFRIGGIDEPLLDYRIHPDNTNTVAKKEEYARYSLEVFRQNLRDCLDDGKEIPLSFLNAFHYNFDALLEEYSTEKLLQCLALLDKLSLSILTTVNPNNHVADIRFMWQFRRRYILTGIAKRLSLPRRLKLFWRSDKKYCTKLIINKIKYIVHNCLRTLKNQSFEKNT